MKIIIFCGVEFTFEKFILPFAKALNKENNEIFISYNKNEYKDRKLNKFGFKFLFNPIERKISLVNLLRSSKKLINDCKKKNIDLIHCHTPIASIAARLAGIFLPKVKIIYTCHGFYFHENMPRFKYIFFFLIEFLLSKITSHILFVSKEDFLLAQKFNFKKKKYLHFISNGVDNNFKPLLSKKQKLLTRNKFKIPLKNITFGVAARFVKEKGFLELIQAFSFASAKYKNISLCICGTRLKGEHNADVSNFLNNAVKSFPDKIFLIGELPSSRMPDFYNALDVFILPSWREGMPMTIIEAMMCGLPVIASNIRGCREAVKNKKNGLLFCHKNTKDLKKSIEFLIKNPLLIDRYSGDSIKVASQKFKLEKIISYQLAIYTKISLEKK